MFIKKIRFLVSLLIIPVMSAALTGCSFKKAQGDGNRNAFIPKETVTLNLFSELSSYMGIQEGWFADIMLQKFNVKLNIVMAEYDLNRNPYDGNYDIIISGACRGENFSEAMKNGYFLDWNSYDTETYMPYVSKYLDNSLIHYNTEDTSSILGIYTTTDLPGDRSEVYYTWDMKFDYYEELGKPAISNIDDWVNVLAQMKEKHPSNPNGEETYALSYNADWDDGMVFGVQTFVSAYYGYERNGIGFYDYKNNKYYGALYMEENGSFGPYLKMLKLNNELYRKGLLDPESVTQDYDSYTSKVEDNRIFASLTGYSGSAINKQMYPVIPTGANLLTYGIGQRMRSISIDSNTQYPELCMAIIDYFYTPEGMLTMYYGPKGDCWDYDENGYTYLTEFGKNCLYDKFIPYGDMYFSDGMPMFNIIPYNHMSVNPDSGEPYAYEYWKKTISEPANSTEASWRAWTGAGSLDKYINSIEPYYIATYDETPEQIIFSETPLKHKYENVSDIIITKSREAITASTEEEFDRIVQEMIVQANESGYEACLTYCENICTNK